MRSKHVANIDAKRLRPFMKNVSRRSGLHTDEADVEMGREFARVSERLCKQVSVSLLFEGNSHDQHDDCTGAFGSAACQL